MGPPTLPHVATLAYLNYFSASTKTLQSYSFTC